MARAKKTTESPPESSSLSFEEALASLEEIVEQMENGDLPLEELVSHYEKGSKLGVHCEKVLNIAQEKIQLITLNVESSSGAPDASSSEDAQLF